MLLLPSGESAGMFDPIITLKLWADHLQVELCAGLGKPTCPINSHLTDFALDYWQRLKNNLQSVTDNMSVQELVDKNLAVDYALPQGDSEARVQMAQALSRWYQCAIDAQDILFTTGGLGALYCVFEYLRRKYLHSRILTPFPHYPYYGLNNHLFPIPVMENPGYRLNADAVRSSIIAAKQEEKFDHEAIHAVIFCYPNNPLGTVLSASEWQAIAKELEALPHALIILDEAYAELDYTDKGASLFSVAPQLRDRMVLLRSGTKGLSAAGARLSVLVCQNKAIMARLLEINVTISIHPVCYLQMAYAKALTAFTQVDKQRLQAFYQPQIIYVQKRLKALGCALPDPDYQVEGSFYVMANLQKLLGQAMPVTARAVFTKANDRIKTDEDLVYSLLFEEKIMLAPGSYFGLDPTLGYVRITCSLGERDLGKILDKIERRLNNAS